MVGPATDSRAARIDAAARAVLDRLGFAPRAAFLLGTGAAPLAEHLDAPITLAAEHLPEGVAFADGAALVGGRLAGLPSLLTGPSLPYHEGHPAEALAFPVRVLQRLGVETLVLTAGVASLGDALPPGTVALVADHLDCSATHVLRAPPDPAVGPRFLDLSEPYDAALRALARAAAHDLGLECAEAVLAAIPGPALPTRAEGRALRVAGADLVAMSLVPDAVVGRHAGCAVLALAAVTQSLGAPASVPAMLAAADVAAPKLTALLLACASALAPSGRIRDHG